MTLHYAVCIVSGSLALLLAPFRMSAGACSNCKCVLALHTSAQTQAAYAYDTLHPAKQHLETLADTHVHH